MAESSVDTAPRRSIRVSWPSLVVLGSVTFLAALVVFTRMSTPRVNSDILKHTVIAAKEIASGRWYSYTLWTPLIVVASWNGAVVSLRTAAVLLLSIAVVARVLMSWTLLQAWGASRRAAHLLSVTLLVSMPVLLLGVSARNGRSDGGVLSGAIYLGRLTGTVWHNSTSIAAAPLVLASAWCAWVAIRRPGGRSLAWLAVALAVTALMKPNYPLAALPVFAIVLARVRRSVFPRGRMPGLRVVAVLAAPTLVVLVVQALLVRTDPNIVPSRFVIAPFETWSYYAPPLLSLVQSWLFPLSVAVCVWIAGERDRWLNVSWAVAGVAVLQLAFLGERDRKTGEVIYDGNWFWGAHAATMVLFIVSAAVLCRIRLDGPKRRVVQASWVVLGLHAATGVLYLWRLWATRTGFAT